MMSAVASCSEASLGVSELAPLAAVHSCPGQNWTGHCGCWQKVGAAGTSATFGFCFSLAVFLVLKKKGEGGRERERED